MNISRELKAQCAQTIRELLNNQKLKDEDRAKLIKYTLNKFFEKHKVEYAQDKRNVAKSILLGNGTSEGVEDSLFRNALLKQLPMTSSFMYESIDYERGIYTVGWDKGQLKGTYKHHSPDDLVNLVKRVNDSFTKIYGPSGKVDNRSNKRTWGTEFTCCKEEELGLEYSNAHMWMSDRGEKVLKDKKLYYWRDSAGPEVDYIIDVSKQLTPIEVKWSTAPKEKDARHLMKFLSEYPEVKHGYIICRSPHRYKINTNITALPWQEIEKLLEALSQ